MIKTIVTLLISLFFLVNAGIAQAAAKGAGDISQTGGTDPAGLFGKVKPPDALAGLLKKDPTGAGAINSFLSNGVVLLYSAAAIALIFMLLWGAFDWLTSGGDKEKLAGAQRKIINAFIGIALFAVAFAVIRVLGQFTGFEFFKG